MNSEPVTPETFAVQEHVKQLQHVSAQYIKAENELMHSLGEQLLVVLQQLGCQGASVFTVADERAAVLVEFFQDDMCYNVYGDEERLEALNEDPQIKALLHAVFSSENLFIRPLQTKYSFGQLPSRHCDGSLTSKYTFGIVV